MANTENDRQSVAAADQPADTVRSGSAIRTEEILRRDIVCITDVTGEALAFKSRSRTMGTAWQDSATGFGQRELWLQLGWQDIK